MTKIRVGGVTEVPGETATIPAQRYRVGSALSDSAASPAPSTFSFTFCGNSFSTCGFYYEVTGHCQDYIVCVTDLNDLS